MPDKNGMSKSNTPSTRDRLRNSKVVELRQCVSRIGLSPLESWIITEWLHCAYCTRMLTDNLITRMYERLALAQSFLETDKQSVERKIRSLEYHFNGRSSDCGPAEAKIADNFNGFNMSIIRMKLEDGLFMARIRLLLDLFDPHAIPYRNLDGIDDRPGVIKNILHTEATRIKVISTNYGLQFTVANALRAADLIIRRDLDDHRSFIREFHPNVDMQEIMFSTPAREVASGKADLYGLLAPASSLVRYVLHGVERMEIVPLYNR